MAVDVADDLPAVGGKARRRIVGEPTLDLAIDGDAVVVVEGDELAQFLGAREGTDFMRNAFHQAAVAQKNISVVVDDFQSIAIEGARQLAFRHRHAHRIRQALTERAGGGFHARRVAIFRVSGGVGMELPKLHQLFHRQIVTGEMEQGVEQHRTVPI